MMRQLVRSSRFGCDPKVVPLCMSRRNFRGKIEPAPLVPRKIDSRKERETTDVVEAPSDLELKSVDVLYLASTGNLY